MKIQTTRFGELDREPELIFKFKLPIIGYNQEDEFIIINSEQNKMFQWLQSTKTPELAFVLTSASYFNIDYAFELPDIAQESLEITSAEDILVFNIAVIPNNNPQGATINLLAPIIFNVNNKTAGQIILSGTNFEVNRPLFAQKPETKNDATQDTDD